MDSSELVIFGTFNDTQIMARPSDQKIDMTLLCQAHGKRYNDYADTEHASRYLAALSNKTGIPGNNLIVDVAQDGQGRPHKFADRRIALHCAAWINADFEVWVYDQIEALVRQGYVTINNNISTDGVVAGLADLYQLTERSVHAFAGAAMKIVKHTENMERSLEAMPARVAEAVAAAAIQVAKEPRVYHNGLDVPTTFPSPENLPYAELRKYVDDIINWVFARWTTHQQTSRRILYSAASEYLGWNIMYNHKSYVKRYGGAIIAMIEEKGLCRQVAQRAYELWGNGQRPLNREGYHENCHVDLTPVGEREGMAYTQVRSVRAGRTRRGNKNAVTAEINVQKAKASRARSRKKQELETAATELSVETVAANMAAADQAQQFSNYATQAEQQLDALEPAPTQEVSPEPWQNFVNSQQ